MDLNIFKTHPYYHAGGGEYFYFKNGKITSGYLDILRMNIKAVKDPFNSATIELKAFFKYRMHNGDMPVRIFPSKEKLLEDMVRQSERMQKEKSTFESQTTNYEQSTN